jgi:hypothetical protein
LFVLVPQDAWNRIASSDLHMPEMPPADAEGCRPALEAARVLIARGIIRDRTAIGWSQAELSRKSRVPVATLNRIERARVTPDQSTLKKLDKAMSQAHKPARKTPVVARRKIA